jgi:hypothetical protein
MIDILRVGIQAVAEYLQRGMVGARPTALAQQACGLRIAAWAAGSVRVGLRLPELPSERFEDGTVAAQARKALPLYLAAATWTGSQEDMTHLERDIPDPEQRRLVLNQVAWLIPRPRGGLDLGEHQALVNSLTNFVARLSHTLASEEHVRLVTVRGVWDIPRP